MPAYQRVIDDLSIRLSMLVGMTLGWLFGHFTPWYVGVGVLVFLIAYFGDTTRREHIAAKLQLNDDKQFLEKFSRDKNAV
jgi:F0F1-type ATP synthase assembly protein I